MIIYLIIMRLFIKLARHAANQMGSGRYMDQFPAVFPSVSAILNRSSRRRARQMRRLEQNAQRKDPLDEAARPSVTAILQVDEEYRRRAAAGKLKTIAPRRFNPSGQSWLPIMHSANEGWQFTALFSNTARAHELNKIRDWVVIYYERDGSEDQCTVVTEPGGSLKGRRVVRGRENECLAHYDG
jgi:DNA polymerase (family X)